MKRKSYFYAFALILILPILFLASACNKDPSPQNIIFVTSNGTEYESEYNLGSYEYGTTIDVFDGLEIYQKMSDDSKNKLQPSDYTLKYYYTIDDQESEISILPEKLNVGKYRISLSTDKISGNIYFTITKAPANYYMIISKSSWNYNEVGATLGVYNADTTDIEYYYIAKQDYESLNNEQKANLLAQEVTALGVVKSYTNAPSAKSITPGTYYAFAFIPETDTTASCITAISDKLQFTVNKVNLTINQDLLNQANLHPTYNYELNNEVGNITLSELSINQALINGIYFDVEWESPNVEVNASNNGTYYNVVISISDKEQSNCYNLIIEGTLQLQATINKGSLNATPFISLNDQESSTKLVYKDEGYTVLIIGYPTDDTLYNATLNNQPITLDEDGRTDYVIKDIGEYIFTITIADEYKNNFVWQNAIGGEAFAHSDPVTRTYTISTPQVLDVSGEYNVINERSEDGSQQNPKYVQYTNIINGFASNGLTKYFSNPEDTLQYSAEFFYKDNSDMIYGTTTNEYTDFNNLKTSNIFEGSDKGSYIFNVDANLTQMNSTTTSSYTIEGTRKKSQSYQYLGFVSINGAEQTDISDNKPLEILEYSAIDASMSIIMEHMTGESGPQLEVYVEGNIFKLKWSHISSEDNKNYESIFVVEKQSDTASTYKLIGQQISITDNEGHFITAQAKFTNEILFDALTETY